LNPGHAGVEVQQEYPGDITSNMNGGDLVGIGVKALSGNCLF